MYQSNQVRIKKEIPSLLPGRGQKGPRPAFSRPPSSSTRTVMQFYTNYSIISFLCEALDHLGAVDDDTDDDTDEEYDSDYISGSESE